MGLYDVIECRMELPDGSRGVTDQTKEFQCCMYHHVIDEFGRLWIDNGHDVEVPKSERPYPDAPEGGLTALFGSMEHVQVLEPADNWTGMIEIRGFTLHMLKGKVVAIDP